MKLTFDLISQEIINALGWTLLHSIWQGAIAAITLIITLNVMKRHSANARYNVAMVTLLLLTAASSITFFRYIPKADFTTKSYPTFSLSEGYSQIPIDESFSFVGFINHHTSLIVNFWFLGVLFFLLRIVGGWLYVQRIKKNSLNEVPNTWLIILEQLRAKTGILKKIRLTESYDITSPVVIGFLKPAILFPIGAINNLSLDQVEAILAHELAHIKRNDYILNIIQQFIETLFFFNPAVWIISKKIRIERENCCDDIAVNVCENSLVLAKALSIIEELRINPPVLALGFAGNEKIVDRILRILNMNKMKPSIYSSAAAFVLILISGCILSFSVISEASPIKVLTDKITTLTTDFLHKTVQDNKTKAPNQPKTVKRVITGSSSDSTKVKESEFAPKAGNQDSLMQSYNMSMGRFKEQMKQFKEQTSKSGKIDTKMLDKAMAELEENMKRLEGNLKSITVPPTPPTAPLTPGSPVPPMPAMAPVAPMPPLCPLPKDASEEDKKRRDEEIVERQIEMAHRIEDRERERAERIRERAEEIAEREHERALEQADREQERAERMKEQALEIQREAQERQQEADERTREDIERRLESEKRIQEGEKNKWEYKEFQKRLKEELKKDGLISDENHYKFKMKKSELYVNGIKQPKSVADKYSKLVKEMVGDGVKEIEKSEDTKGKDVNSNLNITK